MTKRTGFTILEVIVVSAIAVTIMGFLVTNFSRSRNELAATAPSVISEIRRAQNLALSGGRFEGDYRCGFGIKFESDRYVVYAGPVADGTCASNDDRQFDFSGTMIEEMTVLDDALEFKTEGDIYFVPPLPYTYLNGQRAPDTPPLVITIGVAGKSCAPETCRSVRIDRAGQISNYVDEE